MKKIIIEIGDLENDAFQAEYGYLEVERILNKIIEKIPKNLEEMNFKIFDLNGNEGAKVRFKTDEDLS